MKKGLNVQKGLDLRGWVVNVFLKDQNDKFVIIKGSKLLLRLFSLHQESVHNSINCHTKSNSTQFKEMMTQK